MKRFDAKHCFFQFNFVKRANKTLPLFQCTGGIRKRNRKTVAFLAARVRPTAGKSMTRCRKGL